MKLENILKPDEARVLYQALRRHDGDSMAPEMGRGRREELTDALDKLRMLLLSAEEAGYRAGEFERPPERPEAWGRITAALNELGAMHPQTIAQKTGIPRADVDIALRRMQAEGLVGEGAGTWLLAKIGR